MSSKWLQNNKLIFNVSCTLIIVIACITVINFITSHFSYSVTTEEIWDGTSVASSFSIGNGTQENPYLINTGAELAYLKQLIESDQNNIYKDKYYALNKDINLDYHDFSSIGTSVEGEERIFKGHLDGRGYTIKNLQIAANTIDNYTVYGLFSTIEDASIINLNIDGIKLIPEKLDTPYKIGVLAGEIKTSEAEENTSTIQNISISNSMIDLTQTEEKQESKIGGIAGVITEKVTFQNIYFHNKLTSNYQTSVSKLVNNLNSDSKNIISRIETTGLLTEDIPNYSEFSNEIKVENQYIATLENETLKISLNNTEISLEEVIDQLNLDLDTSYYWYQENGNLKIGRNDQELEILSQEQNKVPINTFSFGRSAPIPLHDSGIEENTIYVNDLESDFNYYQGLNYTDFKDTGTLPTGENKNLYNESNLAKVYIKYSGTSLKDSSLVGTIGPGENQSDFIYYKYYPVVNGYITIELIDNPYANRPNNKAFNGWITDYEGAEVSLDSGIYTRYVKIPVTDITNPISITFYADWINATTVEITRTGMNIDNVIGELNNAGIIELQERVPNYDNVDVSGYYIYGGEVNQNATFPTGTYNFQGNLVGGTRCSLQWYDNWYNGKTTCSYYKKPPSSTYDPNSTYYTPRTGNTMDSTMQEVTITPEYTYQNAIEEGDLVAGLYKQVTVTRGGSVSGYYNASGKPVTGTCNTTGGCTYYQFQQYYDGNGNINVATKDQKYYYLVTRDTNIVVLRANYTNNINNTKPFTLTSVNNGNDYRGSATYTINNRYIKAGVDLRVEYITLNSNRGTDASTAPTSSATSSSYIYGNYNNLKIGRGLKSVQTYRNALGVIAGANTSTGTSTSPTRYRLIIESGKYNTLSATNGAVAEYSSGGWFGSTGVRAYLNAEAIYGSDYDRIAKITDPTHDDNLDVYYCASGGWGGSMYAESEQTGIAIHTNIKSGTFGSAKDDYSNGVYVGGREGGVHYAARSATIEGGTIYNLIGGPLTDSGRHNINDTYINIKGGSIDMVIGGAGASETYGNRIINFTGGTVNYGVFGGSNGVTGSDDGNYKGILTGSTFVYIGGNATVGNDTLIQDKTTLFGVESGSVFGIGNGNSDSSKIGTADNSYVMIDGNAKIKQNVYGGGNFGAVGINTTNQTKSNISIKGGTIEGSIYGGGNNNGAGSTTVTSTINIKMENGTVKGSVFGGSRTKGTVYGSTNVNILGGTINTDVYGGGEGGYQSDSDPGTFVTQNVRVNIGSTENNQSLVIDGSVYGGSAYGTVNGEINDTTTISDYDTQVTVNNGIIKTSVYGGGKGGTLSNVTYTPYVLGNVTVNINGGNIGNVFGGNDQMGSPNGKDIVYLNGGTIGNAYGGGNNTGQKETNIYLQGATVTKLFGGSNSSGTVNTSNVQITSGTVTNIYGGNNIGGITDVSNVNVDGATINGDIYGGGSEADTNTSKVTVNKTVVNNVYGGGEKANVDETNVEINGATGKYIFGGSNISGTVKTSKVIINDGIIDRVYGGNNSGGTTTTTNVEINNGTINDVFGGGDNAESTISNIHINNGNITNVYGGGNEAGLNTSNVYINGGTTVSVYGGSNNSGNLTTSNVIVGPTDESTGETGTSEINVTNVYGGNNKGGITSSTNVDINLGTILNVYGGGNEAIVDKTKVEISNANLTNVYGGGNAAGVNENTYLDIDDSILNTNVYGGGNQGTVSGNTEVFITNCTIYGSAYAGGNGATAIVSGNTTINIDGKTIVGTENSKAPSAGCVFGGGNAAATGESTSTNSIATINIVGATIYGNVYGGANTSVVYGATKTNIGTQAVNNNNLIEDDITIKGTVFGGGESNASGSEIYDFSFKSVIGSIDVNIDGTDYLTNNHQFLLSGSIFGSGNASSSEGTSTINIKGLGTKDNPSRNISVQRTNSLTIDHSYIELEGIKDRTNEYSDIPYSFNQIDLLVIKNNTTLLLQRNANLLKEFYSGVDENGKLVPATVEINDETKEVTKNVDNRIYMIPNRNLNITTNQAATTYGKVTGMTFFGMYNSYASGSMSYGVYDQSVNYGDQADAGDAIIGGSYVLGLHKLDHDITKDGFYSNYLNDDFTAVKTAYIDPSEVGDTGYRWIIGMQAINYSFTLTASKYSSLGTYELSMIDFSEGDTIFNVVGFNSEGLKSGVNLIDQNLVPKVTNTQQEANETLGLSMKSETREWTSYGTTKLLSENKGKYTGTTSYKTDSQALAPSLMFYLYHAKNISLDGELGTVTISLQALTPINEIEYQVHFVTITIDLLAKNYDDGDAYDASITYDKKYEMPSATSVNITNQSQFTAYYSLFAEAKEIEDFYGKDNSNYHVLTTNYVLPVGTQITMLDYGISEEKPEYYYYTVDQTIYDQKVNQLTAENEVTYKLSDFIKMGSTSTDNTYNDKESNKKYYSTEYQRTIEEFIFIFDFKETTTTGTHLNNDILFELRNQEDRSLVSVLGIRQSLMKYNLYNSSNAVLKQTATISNNYLYYDVANNMNYQTTVTYDQTENREAIINTNYESSAMGLNIFLYDASGNQVSSSMLLGTSIEMDQKLYFVDSDGTWRINLAGKVSNLIKNLKITTDGTVPPGIYTLKLVLFASSDGLHNSSLENAAITEIPITIVGDDNAIVVDTDDKTKVIDGETSLNENKVKINQYKLTYHSVLENPNIRISIYKRNTDTKDSTTYEEVPFNTLFKNTLNSPETLSYIASSEHEMILTTNTATTMNFDFEIQKPLMSGTYRIVFKLYDKNQLIEEEIEHVIVTKKTEI